MLDGEVVLASDTNIVISMPEKSVCVKTNNDIEKYEALIEKYLNLKQKVCFVTKDDWNIKKEEYIANKKKGIKYDYIEETFKTASVEPKITNIIEDKTTKKINDLFN